eukprot:PLAT8220.1.p1 GENE.PLAT8220.1~~PLAT8220.1.p1  ORF type:complete len:323 (-),score=138.37 PLAT8220.1:171-1139(-)
MGSFLDKPITEKETGVADGNGLVAAYSSMQGWRVTMEDSHSMVIGVPGEPTLSFFAVFDGHGGDMVPKYAAEHLLERVMESEAWLGDKTAKKLGEALTAGFFTIDDEMRLLPSVKSGEDRSGCTAVVGFVTPTHIIIANAGDSRSVLYRGGATVPMSEDHKPYLEVEQRRIEAAGGSVTMRRVNGDLAVSRAMGDFTYKRRDDLPAKEQQVSVEPDIRIEERTDADEALVIACDGIWDVMTNDEVGAFLRDAYTEGETDNEFLACELLDHCLGKGSRDNMTAMIVQFSGAPIDEGKSAAREEWKKVRAERRALEKEESGREY